MSSSYLNIITFVITTVFYYLYLNPKFTYDTLNDTEKYTKYTTNTYMYSAIYCALVIIVQFILNASIITTNCGGSITENIGTAGMYTFFPWILIFGVIIIVLKMYPGFKSAFSDVIGYFYVASSANKVISELLIDKDIQDKLDKDTVSTPQQKEAMQDAAEAIIKICGNTSILINQIVPSNFNHYWNILKPLMKPQYQIDSSGDTKKIQDELFNLVVLRDNVGEAMWYIYTGILLTSIVQLQITSKGCVPNKATMEQNYQTFLENEQTAQQAQAQAESTTYTMT
jgi:hypothetical protein